MKWFPVVFSVLFLSLVFLACEKEDDEVVISAFGETESHKMGQDCMLCHKSGGEGEGWFTIAGTVYNQEGEQTLPNALVLFYSKPMGEGDLVTTVEVDGLGNFFTTNTIDWGEGLYVGVEGDGGTQYMQASVSNGACNTCHGTTVEKIWAK